MNIKARKLRKAIDINSRIKKIRWGLFGLVVLSVFSISMFLDYKALKKDITEAETYYLAVHINGLSSQETELKLKIEGNEWDSTIEEDWRKHKTPNKLFINSVSEFLYATKWDSIGFQIIDDNGFVVMLKITESGNEYTSEIINQQKNISSSKHSTNISGIKQRLLSIEISSIGNQKVDHSFVFSNGYISGTDVNGNLIFDSDQNWYYFRSIKYIGINYYAPVSVPALKETIRSRTTKHGANDDDYRVNYTKTKNKFLNLDSTLPIVSVKLKTDIALWGALIISIIYLSILQLNFRLISIRSVLRSTEPWVFVDTLEPSSRFPENILLLIQAFFSLSIHALIVLSPILSAAILSFVVFTASSFGWEFYLSVAIFIIVLLISISSIVYAEKLTSKLYLLRKRRIR